jgi:hypothetical protein
LFQSLVQGLCVAAEKERKKEQKKKNKRSSCNSKNNLAVETKERTKDKKKEKKTISAVVLSLFCLFCMTTFVSRLTSLSNVWPKTSTVPSLNAYSTCF